MIAGRWERRGEAEQEILTAAKKLAKHIVQRRRRRAPKLAAPGSDYEKFVARFPYFTTVDQARAIQDVLDDLASGRPMDRVICGDVGFGKTEVALRAAAAVALAGKQVAIAVPTTVLARQHVATFRKRFSRYFKGIRQYATAASLGRDALAIMEKALSPNHPKIAIGLSSATSHKPIENRTQ
jgi:transcription-repair coupling factor (superfamily II helicase)